MKSLQLRLGVKSDPIEYRYSYPWLFQVMQSEGVHSLQLGTFFELYQLPDSYFYHLKAEAGKHGISIDSVFTAHRELGGFFHPDPEWASVARRNFERLIEIGAILGAKSVGSNPRAVPRDQMEFKKQGLRRYLQAMKELMHFAADHGISQLTIEPMSCLAEPPTLPEEIFAMAEELTGYHHEHRENTAQIGYCTDIAHGYLDQHERYRIEPADLVRATLPYLYEVHLKNTDARFHSTFGFGPDKKGIIDVQNFRELLLTNHSLIPVEELGCYLEISGPKLGRDYSDGKLEQELRQSLRYLKTHFLEESTAEEESDVAADITLASGVEIAPSLMCVDTLNIEKELRRLESLDIDMLHVDIMDGHFVPNAPLGLAIVEELPKRTRLPVDVHLMVSNNDFYVGMLSNCKVGSISVHVESCVHLDRTLSRIKENGARAGVAINPGTPLAVTEFVLERLDYILIMTVNPGFAGQSMTPASIRKIAECRAFLDERGFSHLPIQVDGNVSFENIPAMVAAGARNLVAGTSSLFSPRASLKANVQLMRTRIREGLQLSANQFAFAR